MYALLPFIFLVLLVLFLYRKTCDQALSGWRAAVLLASVGWGALLAAQTELLSLLRAITLPWLVVSWASATIVMAAVLLFSSGTRIKIRLQPVSALDVLSLLLIAAIIVATGLVALLAPPNNWDSMTYHMSRVAHWTQNRSVAFYPTAILRQLYLNPWAEFAIMHLQVLSGGDRLANLVQWFAMIGTTIAVSSIAERLGAGRYGQLLAALVSAAIPMGILQASSTQNDYVVGFWLACFVYFSLSMSQEHRPRLLVAAAAGAGLGLAVLTKVTAYLYAFPFLAWLCLATARRLRLTWKPLLLLVAIALLLNLGHYSRNLALFGSPLGPGADEPGREYTSSVFTLSTGASNVARNIALHAGTPIPAINRAVDQGIRSLHLALDVDINDPRTTWPDTAFGVHYLSRHEDSAGNPVHLYLILLSLVVLFLARQAQACRPLLAYAACATAAFLLFCLALKWQPWHSRLHLPAFILWSPLIGATLSGRATGRVAWASLVVLALTSVPYTLLNASRPLLGTGSVLTTSRCEQRFVNRPALAAPYAGAVDYIASEARCSDIGLILARDDWEYPLWVLLRNRQKLTRIEHVKVTNASGTVPVAFCPCAIISTRSTEDAPLVINRTVYLKAWSSGPVSVFSAVRD